jgi:ribosomal protein S18 acetylase RimI-like enzyme
MQTSTEPGLATAAPHPGLGPGERLWRGVRRFGLLGALRRAARLITRTIAQAVYVDERHIWYALALDPPPSADPLPDGFRLRRADRADAARLEDLPTIGRAEAIRRLDEGAELWLVERAEGAALACWIFHGRTPVLAARGGWLDLPPDTACLEDTITSPHCRGRGLAPLAWLLIAAQLGRQGLVTLVTKVAEDNQPSRRAVEKAGFRASASMTLRRFGPVERVAVTPCLRDRISGFLVARLVR